MYIILIVVQVDKETTQFHKYFIILPSLEFLIQHFKCIKKKLSRKYNNLFSYRMKNFQNYVKTLNGNSKADRYKVLMTISLTKKRNLILKIDLEDSFESFTSVG